MVKITMPVKNKIPQKTHRKRAYKETKKPLFLAAYRRLGSIAAAAKSARVSREVIYDWRKNDSGFARNFSIADVEITENLESSAISRATEGVPKLLVYRGRILKNEKGQPVVIAKEYSDQLLMFLLKARRPDRYRDNREWEQKMEKQLHSISADLISLVRQSVPDYCPSCQHQTGAHEKLKRALETTQAGLR